MSTRLVNLCATRLGCRHSYPDWYMVRRLVMRKCAEQLHRLMRRPAARMLRDPSWILRLTLARLPELALFPNADDRRETLRAFGTSMRDVRDWRYWMMLSMMALLAAGVGLTVGQLAASALGSIATGATNYWLRLTTMIITLWMLISRTQRFGAALRLRLRLVELGVPVCLKCGYALLGHEPNAKRCPECGGAIDARVEALLGQVPSALSIDCESEWRDQAA